MKSNALLRQEHNVQSKEAGMLTQANELHAQP